MSLISYEDNLSLLANAYLKRDCNQVFDDIIQKKDFLNTVISEDDQIYGFRINYIKNLSAIFEYPVYMVSFSFANIETKPISYQRERLSRLFIRLATELKNIKGYHILKLPTHIADVITCFNLYILNTIFCGGTILYTKENKIPTEYDDGNLKVFFADDAYLHVHYHELMNMNNNAFKTYVGQYHISPVTSEKAPLIYDDWMRDSLNITSTKQIAIAEYNDEPAGFCTIEEDDYAIRLILSASSDKFANMGVYRTIQCFYDNYSYEVKKPVVLGTQFDNYIVQSVWSKLGRRPFYSFYNFHLDNRM